MNIAVIPILFPMITAIYSLLWAKPSVVRRIIISFSVFLQTLFSFWLLKECYQGNVFVTYVGGWSIPFGITLVIDTLSAIMILASNITFFASILYSFVEVRIHKTNPLRLPLIQFLQLGVNLSFITGDFFNLFVAFEIMLTSSYSLLTLESKERGFKEAYPYLSMNLIGSVLFLIGVAMVYGYLGNLNFAVLAELIENKGSDHLIIAFSFLALCVFGLKAAIFPFYYWLPNSYPILPNPFSGIFGGILTKVGIYVMIRIFVTVLPHNILYLHEILLILSGFTMLLGVIGAISRNQIKQILSYHIISQVGYMILAIGFFTPISIAAAIIFTVHNIFVKSSLFLLGGIAQMIYKTDNLKKMGHLLGMVPILGLFFLLQALSLAGIPPFSGFWGKYLILLEGLNLKHYFLVFIAVITSFLTLFSMVKIWVGAFWNKQNGQPEFKQFRVRLMKVSTFILVASALFMAFAMEPVMKISQQASESLFDRQQYVNAVKTVFKDRGIT